ncbi:hypothetical protein HRS9139_00024 [Pyrenophora teres f. teres]|nr:hypothetical protein HRS9139_00024 [Pyrenophora teres f. teres]
MHILLRFLFLPLYLAVIVQCLPSKHILPRGQCVGRLFITPSPPAPLPPVDINITPNVNGARNIGSLPWTTGQRTPGHIWRWRAAGGRGSPVVQVQLYGYFGAHVELRVTAPATADRLEVQLTPNENVNGGGAEGWGETLCLSAKDVGRRDATYVLHLSLGNMYP